MVKLGFKYLKLLSAVAISEYFFSFISDMLSPQALPDSV